MAFDYQSAKAAGYSDEEIYSYLSSQGMANASPGQAPASINKQAALAAGYTPQQVDEFGRGQRMGAPTQQSTQQLPFLQRIAQGAGNVFLPRSLKTARTIGTGEMLRRNLPTMQQQMSQRQHQIEQLQQKARLVTDPRQRDELNRQARQLIGATSQVMPEFTAAAHRQAGIGQGENVGTTRAGFFAKQMPGTLAEIGTLLAPSGGATATTGLGRVGKAALSGAVQSGIYAGTTPEELTVGERLGRTATGAVTGGVTTGILAGVGEAARGIFGAKPRKALAQVSEQTVTPPGSTQKMDVINIEPRKKLSAGGKAYYSQFTVPTKLAKRLRTGETVNAMIDYGVAGSLEEIADKADMVTGADGAITRMTRDAIGFNNAAISNPGDALTAMIQESELAKRFATPEQIQATSQHISRIIGDVQAKQPSPNVMNAIDAYDTAKALEAMGWNLRNKSTYLTERLDVEALGDMYLAAAETLMDNVDNQAGQVALDAVKTPQNLEILSEVSPKLAKQVMNAKTVSELRSLAAPFVRVKKMVDLTNDAAMSAFSNFGKAISGDKGIMGVNLAKPATLIKPLLESQTVNTRGGALLDRISQAKQGPMGQAVTRGVRSGPANALMRLLSMQATRGVTGEGATPPPLPTEPLVIDQSQYNPDLVGGI